ncbi:MAG: fimbrial protein [Bacteroidales bacterium]|nr:fimbrial protein [Bacteroidales bacterium]
MKKRILHTIVLWAAALACISCVKENFTPSQSGVGEARFLLDFGVKDDIAIQTKSTLDAKAESRVFNLYVFVFNRNGDKVTGEYFGSKNLKASADEVRNATDNCWYVSNSTTTTGSVLFNCSAGEGFTLYVLSNLDSDMVRISSDVLAATVRTEDDLKNFTAYLNQKIVTRNGYFPMSGKISDITINDSNGATSGKTNITGTVTLSRIDAKVRFVFKTGNTPDAQGQTIKSFEPRQWKVVNVPRTGYILPRDEDCVNVAPATAKEDYSKYAAGFFDTEFVNFEDFPESGTSGFSFYMMENRQTPKKKELAGYQDRSRAQKLASGLNEKCTVTYSLDGQEISRDMRMFEYANDFSTYVVVTGYVEMELVDDKAGKVLGGDVQYIIHLGGWGKDIANFKTERNTSYTYTVTVNSVNNIRVEVETSKGAVSDVKENQPGASGHISIAKEEIALCDCHYVSKTISFHLTNFFNNSDISKDNCIVDELTWAVKTPFGEGEPITEGGVDVTSGLDYKWVHFRLNKKDANGKYYSDKRRKYTPRTMETKIEWQENKEDDGTPGLAGFHNDGIMDVAQLCVFIKNEVHKYLDNPASSAFDNLESTDLSLPKISLTVFVDEYYYEKHPITGEEKPDLWKTFVNAEDRKLHILCNSEKSKDLESSTTGSVVTIQQRSIQCIYNTDPSYTVLQTAWGVENQDEYDGMWDKYWSVTSGGNRGNDKRLNGLYNSCKEWELSPAGTSNAFTTGVQWSKYMNYEVENDTPNLQENYRYMRYACLTRNRDNDGNGKIDRNEVRWYLASINQLLGLYVGDAILNANTRLYNKSPEDKKSDDYKSWQQHIVSSTAFDGKSNDPTMLWAEEGTSTSRFYHGWADVGGTAIRCVRNLGYIDGKNDESYDIDKEFDDYITAEKQSDGSYIFTCTHLNEKALRYYTSKELILSDERALENCLYKKFQSSPTSSAISSQVFREYNETVDKAIDEGRDNPYCPEGYRTPSQTEAAVMRYYMEGWNESTMTRTYWSLGPLGPNPKKDKNGNVLRKYGFSVQGTNITVNHGAVNAVRCVRDIRVN